ncbi:hypothetical protein BFP78_06970 [Gaetbulibacter sp. 5U11]|nr:hypothetical protein BFP78_06970 [Gaetbulibacter sp. 5U11]
MIPRHAINQQQNYVLLNGILSQSNTKKVVQKFVINKQEVNSVMLPVFFFKQEINYENRKENQNCRMV